MQGIGTGTTNSAGVPEISGSMNFGVIYGYGTGAFSFIHVSSYGQMVAQHNDNYNFDFNASRCSDIYGNSETVMPKSINMPAIIYLGMFS